MSIQQFFVCTLLGVFFMSSCNKQKIEKTEDTWRLVRVSKIKEVTHHEEWDFTDGVITMVEFPLDSVVAYPDTLGAGTYVFDPAFTKLYVEVDGIGQGRERYNGKWRILEINKDILILFKKDNVAWLYREFVRN
jgi:hypothetical protein